eukprot:scaffold73032_cov59-Cyclotella_meneghiniana.AAC.3
MTSDLHRQRIEGDDIRHVSAVNEAILRASGLALVVVNQDGVILSTCNEAPALFGYKCAGSLINQNIGMLLNDVAVSGLDLQNYTRRRAHGIHYDGSFLDMEIGLASINSTSKPGQIAITMKQLSPDLRDNLTNKIIDASFDALFCINQHGIIQMVNQKSCEVFGWSREEFIGQNISMIMPEEHAVNHDNYLAQYMKTGIKHMMGTEREVEARCKDGSTFPCVLGLNEVGIDDGGERVMIMPNEHAVNHDNYLEQYMKTGIKHMMGTEREVEARCKDGSTFPCVLGLNEVGIDDGGERVFCGFIRSLANLKGAQNLTHQIIDASFDALFCINQHGIIQMVNQKSCEVFGWSREEFIGQNINMIMPKEHAVNHDNYLAQYIKTGIKHMMGTEREVEARCKDGSTFPCVLGLNEVGIDDGGERVFCGFIRSLANLKGAQNLTHQIIDASFDALFCINQHGIIQMVNQKSCEVFGWSREEFIGKNISMIMPEEHAVNHDNYLEQYMKTGVKHMMGTEREVEARCKDGRIFPCILGLNEVNTPGSKDRVFCGFIRSLSREKSLEKRASDTEEQNIKNAREILEQKSTILGILDSSFDSLFVITEERIIQMVNQKSCDIFGWTKEEFIGKNINMIMTDDVAANHDQYVEIYMTTGVKKMIGKRREVIAKRKDGTTFPAALGLAEPQAAGLICGFLRDLTHEKAAQAEIIREQLLNSKIIDAR